MYLAVNGKEIAHYPSDYECGVLDLDNADTTYRTADGGHNRERVAVKRQIAMTFPAMKEEKLSELLQSMKDEYFQFTYFDILTGGQRTGTFYVGDRKAKPARLADGSYMWEGLSITLTER